MVNGSKWSRIKRLRTIQASCLFVLAACAAGPFMNFVLVPSRTIISPVQVQGMRKTGVEQRDSNQPGTNFHALAFFMVVTAIRFSSRHLVVGRAKCDEKDSKNDFPEVTTVSMGTCSTRLPYADASLAGVTRRNAPFLPISVARRNPKTLVTRNLLMPLNIKERKPRKPLVKPFHHCTRWKFRGYDMDNNKPYFGKYALQAREEAWISSKCIETVRRVIVRTMARKGKSWIRIFPDQGICNRVAESRMGAGKGNLEYWVKAVRPGQILFEIDGVSEDVARLAFHRSKFRLSCKTCVLVKDDGPSRFELGLEGEAGGGSRAERARQAKMAALAKKK